MDGAPRLTTRAKLLAGAAALAGGAAFGRRGGSADAAQDGEILDMFLTLERVQAAFYQQAQGHLTGELKRLAQAVAGQEAAHVAMLEKRLGGAASAAPESDFGDAFSTPKRFRDSAIELEEAAIAAYIGQAANLSRPARSAVAPLISVEARQVAWLRDLAGVSPAPRAADPSRPAEAVLKALRAKGYLQ